MNLAGIPALGLAVTAGAQGVKLAGQFAGMLRTALGGETPTVAPKKETAESSGKVTAEIATRLEELRSRIRALLSNSGIEGAESVTLSQDAFDRLRVADGHPRTAEIESLLATYPEIGDAFRAVAEAIHERSPGTREGLPATYEVDGKPTFDLVAKPAGRPAVAAMLPQL